MTGARFNSNLEGAVLGSEGAKSTVLGLRSLGIPDYEPWMAQGGMLAKSFSAGALLPEGVGQ